LKKTAGQLQDIERHKLNAMGAFAEAQTCRRLVCSITLAKGVRKPAVTAISALIRRNSMMA
jgi:ATP-dependent DNA helicase RecQ